MAERTAKIAAGVPWVLGHGLLNGLDSLRPGLKSAFGGEAAMDRQHDPLERSKMNRNSHATPRGVRYHRAACLASTRSARVHQ